MLTPCPIDVSVHKRFRRALGAAALLAALAACADGGDRPPPALGGGRTGPVRADGTAPSGIVAQHADRLDALRRSTASETEGYSIAIAAINGRLQAGTTPANRDLVERWNAAQGHLDTITANLGQLDALAAQVRQQVTTVAAVPVATRPAPDRRAARTSESEADRTRQELRRLAGEIDGEIARQSTFLMTERPTLAALGYAVNAGRPGTLRTAGGAGR
ncbi:hypothetical protein [Reyranella sp. CPCC 100927]|uniref:hypothetical protein n=1 Tax=Reyranella sp. CPCC 100927 TaxID=2599616 RepID=UPI0011B5C12F|nr:hypothetical protein [Reyranella sp. CPCC 100927]TWT15711.1 hypothetical protein FQU96_05030 [Reyranella sp. CPCC 100927]